nr:hypothetical protein [Tanacetum cinerariifolium]
MAISVILISSDSSEDSMRTPAGRVILFDSSSRHSSSDHSSSDIQSTSAGPCRKRRSSPMTSVPALPLVSRALSPVRADLIPPPELRGLCILRCQRIFLSLLRREQQRTTEGIQREQGRRIVGFESAVIALTERVAELERDNQRLRGTASVESQRVDRLQRGMKMPNTRSRASMTHEEIEELIARRVAEEMEAREVSRNLEALNENEEEQEEQCFDLVELP